MKRFIFLFAVGTLLLVGAQVALSAGIHPERPLPLRFLLQSGLGVVLGTALVASGMMGLAEGYERIAARLSLLLATKQLDKEPQLTIKSGRGLNDHNRSFWSSYRNSALAVCLFMGGFFSVALFCRDLGFFLYLAGLSAGVAVFGLLALFFVSRSLVSLRRTHRSVTASAQLLERQPDLAAEAPPDEPQVRWAIRRRSPSRYSRSLGRRSRTELRSQP